MVARCEYGRALETIQIRLRVSELDPLRSLSEVSRKDNEIRRQPRFELQKTLCPVRQKRWTKMKVRRVEYRGHAASEPADAPDAA